MPHVYILESEKHRKFYIGSTSNLAQRIKRHYSGDVPYTKPYLPVKLVFSQEYQTLSFAKKVEYRLKSFKRRDFIHAIVRDGKIKAPWGVEV